MGTCFRTLTWKIFGPTIVWAWCRNNTITYRECLWCRWFLNQTVLWMKISGSYDVFHLHITLLYHFIHIHISCTYMYTCLCSYVFKCFFNYYGIIPYSRPEVHNDMEAVELRQIIYLYLQVWMQLISSTILDFSSSNLTKVPPGPTNETVSTFILAHNKIKHLFRNSFQNYNGLIKINLKDNTLQIIHNGTFDNITTLEVLILRLNCLVMLPVDLGPSTSVLMVIDLSDGAKNHEIYSYPYFSAFTNLEELNVGGATVGELQDWFYPSNLKELENNEGKINKFPSYSLLTPNITLISMNHKKIR